MNDTTTGTQPTFKVGDRVRLKAKPDITGSVVLGAYPTGRSRIKWDGLHGPTKRPLRGFYWPEELELVPEPLSFDEVLLSLVDGGVSGPHVAVAYNHLTYPQQQVWAERLDAARAAQPEPAAVEPEVRTIENATLWGALDRYICARLDAGVTGDFLDEARAIADWLGPIPAGAAVRLEVLP